MSRPATNDPLLPRWALSALGEARAGTTAAARVELENLGTATWRSFDADGLQLSYHWLDLRGNAIVWDGPRTAFSRPVAPGERISLDVSVIAPRPPGRYVLRFDLVEEHRFWLSEVGVATLDVEVDVLPRIAARRLGVVVHGGPSASTDEALALQDEPVVPADATADGGGNPDDDGGHADAHGDRDADGGVAGDATAVAHLVSGARPAPNWSRLLLDAHEEGWGVVGPALVAEGGFVERRRAANRLARWAPGGRNPRFDGPLLLPSLVVGLELAQLDAINGLIGLPAVTTDRDGLFEGRALVRLPTRSGRPPR